MSRLSRSLNSGVSSTDVHRVYRMPSMSGNCNLERKVDSLSPAGPSQRPRVWLLQTFSARCAASPPPGTQKGGSRVKLESSDLTHVSAWLDKSAITTNSSAGYAASIGEIKTCRCERVLHAPFARIAPYSPRRIAAILTLTPRDFERVTCPSVRISTVRAWRDHSRLLCPIKNAGLGNS